MQSRTRTTSHVLLLIAAGALGATLNLPIPAPAQEIGVQLFAPPISAVPPSQLPLPHGGATLERYFARLRIEYAQLDADQDGKLTQRDVDTHALMEAAWLRVYALHSVMRFDLDGDGAVTEDEVRRAMR